MSGDEVFLLHLVSPKHEVRITQVVIRATPTNIYIFMAILIITTIQPTAPLLKTDKLLSNLTIDYLFEGSMNCLCLL